MSNRKIGHTTFHSDNYSNITTFTYITQAPPPPRLSSQIGIIWTKQEGEHILISEIHATTHFAVNFLKEVNYSF